MYILSNYTYICSIYHNMILVCIIIIMYVLAYTKQQALRHVEDYKDMTSTIIIVNVVQNID